MKKGKEPAFPVLPDNGFPADNHSGLTKREYFAAKAMQAILSAPEHLELILRNSGIKDPLEAAVKYSVVAADKLLTELEK